MFPLFIWGFQAEEDPLEKMPSASKLPSLTHDLQGHAQTDMQTASSMSCKIVSQPNDSVVEISSEQSEKKTSSQLSGQFDIHTGWCFKLSCWILVLYLLSTHSHDPC